MWTQAQGVDFLLALVVDKDVEHFLGEDITFHEELTVTRKSIECGFERPRHRSHFGQLFWPEIVDVLVERRTGVNAILDSVDPCHEHSGERQVRVTTRVGRTEFRALSLGGCRVHRDADCSRTIATRVSQVYGSFESGHQTFV